MSQIHSRLDTTSADFAANREAMQALVADLNARLAEIAQGGGAANNARHQGRGKLLPRERINQLLDPGSPFLELPALAAWQVYEEPVPAAGIITGLGQIAGRLCLLVVNDATVKGGTYYPLTVKKHLRAQAIAERLRLPCLYLVGNVIHMFGIHLEIRKLYRLLVIARCIHEIRWLYPCVAFVQRD